MVDAKLPVLATVRQAYGALKAHAEGFGAIAKVSVIVAIVALFISVALYAAASNDAAFASLSTGEKASAVTSLFTLVFGVGIYIIIVRWHRLLVRDLSPMATRRGAFGGSILYMARAFFLGAMAASVAVLSALLPIALTREILPADIRWYFAVAVTVLAIGIGFALAARLSLILPAGAVGDRHINLRRSWEITRGNTLRLLGGSMLSSGPAIAMNVVSNAADQINRASGSDVTTLAAFAVWSLVLLGVALVIQASFLSYAYVFFVRSTSPSP